MKLHLRDKIRATIKVWIDWDCAMFARKTYFPAGKLSYTDFLKVFVIFKISSVVFHWNYKRDKKALDYRKVYLTVNHS